LLPGIGMVVTRSENVAHKIKGILSSKRTAGSNKGCLNGTAKLGRKELGGPR